MQIISAIYNLLWGDLFQIPLPGGGQIGISCCAKVNSGVVLIGTKIVRSGRIKPQWIVSLHLQQTNDAKYAT